MIPSGLGFADVGTDHAYLPLIMLRRGYTGNIFATDVNKGPLEKAKYCIEEHELTDMVTLRLCDGLDGVEPGLIDTIVIAGMGGDTITGILDRAEWCFSARYRLILQPVTKPEILRYWLINNGFNIENDDFVTENGTLYQIIVAIFGKSEKYSDAELFVGKYVHIKDSEHFDALIDTHIRRFESASKGLGKAADTGLSSWHGIINGILLQLYEMKGKRHGKSL